MSRLFPTFTLPALGMTLALAGLGAAGAVAARTVERLPPPAPLFCLLEDTAMVEGLDRGGPLVAAPTARTKTHATADASPRGCT